MANHTVVQTDVKQSDAVSTRQASELLGVHESSIKRWCNAGDLAFWLTPGGHRRIPVMSLVDFADREGLRLPLAQFGRYAATVWAGTGALHRAGDYSMLREQVIDWLSRGEVRYLINLFGYLKEEGLAYGVLFDQLIGWAMHRVGVDYLHSRISIGDEHLMTQAMRDTLIALSTSIILNDEDGDQPVALVGCARGEVHELGALMVRVLLQEAGWRVLYLGLNVPTEEFAHQQTKTGAQLVCISMMPPMSIPEAKSIVGLLDRMYDSRQPFKLALGGGALGEASTLAMSDLKITEVRLFNQIAPFGEWIGRETDSQQS